MTALDVLIAQDLEIGTASKRKIIALWQAQDWRGNVVVSDMRRILGSTVGTVSLRAALILAGCKPIIHADREEV